MIHDFVGLHLFCDSIIRTLFWITYGTLYKCICRRQWAKRCGHLKHELTTYKTIHASTFFQRKARPNSQLKDSLPRRAIPNQTSTYRTKIPILIHYHSPRPIEKLIFIFMCKITSFWPAENRSLFYSTERYIPWASTNDYIRQRRELWNPLPLPRWRLAHFLKFLIKRTPAENPTEWSFSYQTL